MQFYKSAKVTSIIGIWIFILFIGYAITAQASDYPQWRGPERNGILKETGLLKEWPEGGPKLLWSIKGIGKGFSSPSISGDSLYVTGMRDDIEFISAFDLEGNLKWKKDYGKAYTDSFPDARTTPTVEGDSIYVISGRGEVVCLDAASGNINWSVKAFKKFKGKHGAWGTAESPLIVDDKVIYTPCGKQTTVVALDKKTGKTVWKTRSLNDQSGYVSPLLIERGGLKQIVTVTGKYIIGINAENGNIIWDINYIDIKPTGKSNDINTNTPLYHDGRMFITSGYNHTGLMVELSEDGREASVAWTNPDLDVHHGASVLVDGYLYGANWINNGNGKWVCLDWNTGKTMYETKWFNKGSIITAEGMLYCYEEKAGNLGLVEATPDEFRLISSFKIKQGKGPHWGHPVINDGKLYIRHGNAMMVYDIKAK